MLSDKDRLKFRHNAGWGGSFEIPVTADWSVRRFFRLSDGSRTAILMQSYPDHHPQSLVGHKIADYIRIADYLRARDVRVPHIYAVDEDAGCLLVEDFGDVSMHDAVKNFEIQPYELACNLLIKTSSYQANDLNLKTYGDTHLFTGKRRFMDWFAPSLLMRGMNDDELDVMSHAWAQVENQLSPISLCFQHGDFHPHNIMMLGNDSLGLIDFQGALFAPLPYDLVNLLEDARRYVPQNIKQECKQKFYNQLHKEDQKSFHDWYDVMAAQFHFRVIGQAYRLAIREGKTRLFEIVPILQNHIAQDLTRPLLAPLRDALQKMKIDVTRPPNFDIKKISGFIRTDAF